MSDHGVWIFNGAKGRYPGGAFTDRRIAEAWIRTHELSGVLTWYPLDVGCLEWAVAHGCTNISPSKLPGKLKDPEFIGSFSSASQPHYHYLNGVGEVDKED